MEEIRAEGKSIAGEVAIAVAPGTLAEARDRLVVAAIGARLHALANELGVSLVAAPSAYARPLPGKDAEGRTRFKVSARVEGDHLVPVR